MPPLEREHADDPAPAAVGHGDQLADAERAGQARRYLKSDLDFLGVSVPGIRSAVTGTAAIEVLRLFTPKLESASAADAIQRSLRLISANLKRHIPSGRAYR